MKRSKEKPAIYETLRKQFNIKWNDGIIITYGDTIYCKWKVSREKRVHEKVHSKQQKSYGVISWWDRYLKDKEFRLDQELQAYKKEKSFIMTIEKNIKLREAKIEQIAKDLSSSMYGNIITYEAAKLLLD